MGYKIDIQIEKGFCSLLQKRWLGRIARESLNAAKAPSPATISLVIAGDDRVRELNRLYRKKDKTTDVLAFPAQETEGFILPPEENTHLGDVIISYPQAARQAQEYGHSLERELSLLVAHGVLHLLGYDHEKVGEGKRMRAKEKEILSLLERLKVME